MVFFLDILLRNNVIVVNFRAIASGLPKSELRNSCALSSNDH